jgi:hypothetical protein
LAPTRVTDTLGEMGIAHYGGDLQILKIDRVVVTQQRQGGLVLKVAPLSANLLVFPLQQGNRLLAAVAAFLPARDTALRFGELLLSRAVMAGVLDDSAICCDEKHLISDGRPEVKTLSVLAG